MTAISPVAIAMRSPSQIYTYEVKLVGVHLPLLETNRNGKKIVDEWLGENEKLSSRSLSHSQLNVFMRDILLVRPFSVGGRH